MGEKFSANNPRPLADFSDRALIVELYDRKRIRDLYCRASLSHTELHMAKVDIARVRRGDIANQLAHFLLDNPELVKNTEFDYPDEFRKAIQTRVMVVTNPSLPTVYVPPRVV